MKTKRTSVGKVIAYSVTAMELLGVISRTIVALIVLYGVIPESAASTVCWLLNAVFAFGVSCRTAKRLDKYKIQITVMVMSVYLGINILMGCMLYSDTKIHLSIWLAIMAGASVFGGMMACMKKERKR